jgi:peptidoglycan/xylan/chitin deacetylase (PgdA/CDA1 family)
MVRIVPILMYHSVGETGAEAYRRWVIPSDIFAEHMRLLSEQGFEPLAVSTLVSLVTAGSPLPSKPVVITFDDGLQDFLSGALPTLVRYQFPATLFVVTGYVGGTSEWLRSVGESRRPMLTWDEIRQISALGIECGAHSHSHPQLDVLSPSAAFHEMHTSKCLLEDKLGQPVLAFAYPYGYSNAATRRLAREIGFTSACRVRHALSSSEEDRFALSRITMTRNLSEDDILRMLDGGLPVAPPIDRAATVGWRIARQFARLMRSEDDILRMLDGGLPVALPIDRAAIVGRRIARQFARLMRVTNFTW